MGRNPEGNKLFEFNMDPKTRGVKLKENQELALGIILLMVLILGVALGVCL